LTGTGSSVVTSEVAANPHNQERTGVLTVADQSLTVRQSGVPCTYQLSAPGSSHGEGEDTGEVVLATGADCPWSLLNPNDWITILSQTNGTGPALVIYWVARNEGPARSGTF